MIYSINIYSELAEKISDIPADGSNYGISDIDYDLSCYTWTVGQMDSKHNIQICRPKQKSYSQIVNAYKKTQEKNDRFVDTNNTLGKQIVDLSLLNAQKDAQITQLGQQIVQMQLDVAALKGGAET